MYISSAVDDRGFIWYVSDSVCVQKNEFGPAWEGTIHSFKFDTDGSILAVVLDQNDDAYDVSLNELGEVDL